MRVMQATINELAKGLSGFGVFHRGYKGPPRATSVHGKEKAIIAQYVRGTISGHRIPYLTTKPLSKKALSELNTAGIKVADYSGGRGHIILGNGSSKPAYNNVVEQVAKKQQPMIPALKRSR